MSLLEINRAMAECTSALTIGAIHALASRATSAPRRSRKPPSDHYPSAISRAERKDAKLHVDSYLYIEGDHHSAPRIRRHKKMR
jgi:hypothetical protein